VLIVVLDGIIDFCNFGVMVEYLNCGVSIGMLVMMFLFVGFDSVIGMSEFGVCERLFMIMDFWLVFELSVMSWLGDRLICMGCGEFLVLMVMVWLDVLVLTSVLDIRFLLF